MSSWVRILWSRKRIEPYRLRQAWFFQYRVYENGNAFGRPRDRPRRVSSRKARARVAWGSARAKTCLIALRAAAAGRVAYGRPHRRALVHGWKAGYKAKRSELAVRQPGISKQRFYGNRSQEPLRPRNSPQRLSAPFSGARSGPCLSRSPCAKTLLLSAAGAFL